MDPNVKTVLVQFRTEQNETIGVPLEVPVEISVDRLQLICDRLKPEDEEEKNVPYLFFLNDTEIKTSLSAAIASLPDESGVELEKCLDIVCAAQSVFHVESVTRCTTSIEGHTDAIVSVAFSPDGTGLATGSGDTTVRFWDVTTETPLRTGTSHRSWVLAIAWSPDGARLASGDRDGLIYVWDIKTGQQTGCLRGHQQWINGLAWEPFHCNRECRRIVSASKDGSARIWDVILQRVLFTLNGHTQNVSAVKWGGSNLIYTASHDRTVKVWCAKRGILCRTLEGHGHWVNTLALSTEYTIRLGRYDPLARAALKPDEAIEKRIKQILQHGGERLVSGSDDFTLFLWRPETEKKPVCRMTGHQQLINDVKFSPDTRWIASASFDKSIKLWDGQTGKFRTTLRGHVKAVYQVAWSADNRLLVSASADSTLKVWNIGRGDLLHDLPGHQDEVYALDWSPDGQRVASGGKDRILKLWRK